MTVVGRMLLGFLSAAVAVLVFQQGSWALLHAAGLMPPAYPTTPIPPYGLPQIANLCFWGGVWGAGLGLLPSRLTAHWLVAGAMLGVAAVIGSVLLVPVIKGVPWATIVDALNGRRLGIGLLLNVPFGVGAALILRLLLGRLATRAAPASHGLPRA